ncbi:hypothetical protein [Oceanivirga miroungae]|nr:hypothetical protein [Oceanivirga miroungae]
MNRIKLILFIFFSFVVFSKEDKFIKVFNKEDEIITYVYELKNKEAEDIKKSIKIFDDLKVSSYENKLILQGPKKNVNNLKLILNKLDTLKKQVVIKLSLLDVSHDLITRLLVNLDKKEKESLIKHIELDRMQKLKKYKESGDIKLKLMPSIIVLDGEKAIVSISNLTMKLEAKIKKDYVELALDIEFISSNNKKEYIKTKINVENNKVVSVSKNKTYENYSFRYKTSKKKLRDLYIEIEVNII